MRTCFSHVHPQLIRRSISIGTVFDQLPWSSHFARLLAPIRNAVQRMIDVGRQRAAIRQNKGSATKDLFYYLVRCSVDDC